MMIERKIYSGWAYTENENEKSSMNCEIYQEIKNKAEVSHVGTGFGHKRYEVIDNPENLSGLEIALICDRGNLCFGYDFSGECIKIYTD